MSLEIRKKGNKNFTHIGSGYTNEYGANDITIIFDGNTIKLRSFRGRVIFNKEGYNLPDVSIYDDSDTGAEETYPNITEFKQRLINLGYPFKGGTESENGDTTSNNFVKTVNLESSSYSSSTSEQYAGNVMIPSGTLSDTGTYKIDIVFVTQVSGNVASTLINRIYLAGSPGGLTNEIVESRKNNNSSFMSTIRITGIISNGVLKLASSGFTQVSDISNSISNFSGISLNVNSDIYLNLTTEISDGTETVTPRFLHVKIYGDVNPTSTNVSTFFLGDWNASTNTPTLSNSDTGLTGFEYKVSVAGSHDFGAGSITFGVGDIIANNGSIWYKKVNNNQSSIDIITAVKTSDETKNNDNSVALDSELQISLDANSYYEIEVQLLYEAGGTPDLRTQFEVPTGSGGSFWRTNNTSNINSNNLTSIISNLGLGVGTSTHTRMRVNIYTDTTSGTFGVKWAQNKSHSHNTTIYRGSSIKAIKLN